MELQAGLTKRSPAGCPSASPAADMGWQKCQVWGRRESQYVADRPASALCGGWTFKAADRSQQPQKGPLLSIPSLNPTPQLCPAACAGPGPGS